PDISAARRKEIRSLFERENLQICCIATGARLATADPSELDKHLAEARSAIDLAADLAVPFVRTFGGPRGKGDLRGIVRHTASAYSRLLEQAHARGVTLLMETHDEWCVSAQVRAVVELVDSPRLKVLWDIMHPQRFMERPEETMRNIGEMTAHLHAHDGRYDAGAQRITTVPMGEGIIDHATPLRLLQAAGFDGFFSVEVIHRPGTEHDADGALANYAREFKKIMAGLAAS
ncbi:MAG: sugar phosphate isomerase/epimerase family protein, partial [Kiritimatiellia bacterium]